MTAKAQQIFCGSVLNCLNHGGENVWKCDEVICTGSIREGHGISVLYKLSHYWLAPISFICGGVLTILSSYLPGELTCNYSLIIFKAEMKLNVLLYVFVLQRCFVFHAGFQSDDKRKLSLYYPGVRWLLLKLDQRHDYRLAEATENAKESEM